MNVLVLDDDPSNVSWLKDFCSARGASIRFVTTYDEAVFACDADLPDLAIVDIMIGAVDSPPLGANLANAPPNWVGLRFVRHLRVERKRGRNETAIVVYTGLDRADLKQMVELAFQSTFCPKSDVPYFRSILKSLIKK